MDITDPVLPGGGTDLILLSISFTVNVNIETDSNNIMRAVCILKHHGHPINISFSKITYLTTVLETTVNIFR
jgi:hypothetical protein